MWEVGNCAATSYFFNLKSINNRILMYNTTPSGFFILCGAPSLVEKQIILGTNTCCCCLSLQMIRFQKLVVKLARLQSSE